MTGFEREVRVTVIRTLAGTGRAPTADDLAALLDRDVDEVEAALRSLHRGHRRGRVVLGAVVTRGPRRSRASMPAPCGRVRPRHPR